MNAEIRCTLLAVFNVNNELDISSLTKISTVSKPS